MLASQTMLEALQAYFPAEVVRCFVALLLVPIPLPQWLRLALALSSGFFVAQWEVPLFQLTVTQSVREIIYGALILLPFALVVQIVRYSGEFLDAFRGHSLGRILAPFSESSRSVLSLFLEYGILALVTASGGLVLLFLLLAYSFQALPVVLTVSEFLPLSLVRLAFTSTVHMLTYAFLLVSPFGVILLGVDVVFGVGSLILGKVPLQSEASQVKNLMVALVLIALFSEDSLLGDLLARVQALGEKPNVALTLLESIAQKVR